MYSNSIIQLEGAGLTAKDLKGKLRNLLKVSGTLNVVKSQIRTELIKKFMKDSTIHEKKVSDFQDRLIISCIYNFLHCKQLFNTISVLMPEIGIDSVDMFLSEKELYETLHLDLQFVNESNKVNNSTLHHIIGSILNNARTVYLNRVEAANYINKQKDVTSTIMANQIFGNTDFPNTDEKLNKLREMLALRERDLDAREKQFEEKLLILQSQTHHKLNDIYEYNTKRVSTPDDWNISSELKVQLV
jgi:hypothetical protein